MAYRIRRVERWHYSACRSGPHDSSASQESVGLLPRVAGAANYLEAEKGGGKGRWEAEKVAGTVVRRTGYRELPLRLFSNLNKVPSRAKTKSSYNGASCPLWEAKHDARPLRSVVNDSHSIRCGRFPQRSGVGHRQACQHLGMFPSQNTFISRVVKRQTIGPRPGGPIIRTSCLAP